MAYGNFRELSADKIAERLALSGLSRELLEEREKVIGHVIDEARSAVDLGIAGTPTFVVDGIVLKPGAAGLAPALKFELERRNAWRSGERLESIRR
jgi:hypothetical protein